MSADKLKITLLGCGTSVGVPCLGRAGWGLCDPQEPKNRRQRFVHCWCSQRPQMCW